MSDVVQPLDEARLGNDRALLDRYAAAQEPAAFTELSRRYAGMVYATCLRITGNAHDAEELTQDCFFELARRASTICSSVGGWLHRVATHRALNAVRSRSRRRKVEQNAAAATQMRAGSPAEVSWREVEPLVDRAIDELPEELRAPILLHYLENRAQSHVARQLGVHQSTVSRRIREGLKRLRDRLRRSGVVMGAAPLAALLAANMTHPAGPQLLASLGKIALAGAGSAVTVKAVGGLGASSVKFAAWAKAGAVAALPVLAQLVAGGWFGILVFLVVVWILWRWPSLPKVMQLAFGAEHEYWPFPPLARWTWTIPPPNWRKALVESLLASVLLGTMAVAVPFPGRGPKAAWAVLFALYAAVPLTTAVRIGIRVRRCGVQPVRGEHHPAGPPPELITVVQYVGFSAVATLFVVSLALLYVRTDPMPRFYAVCLVAMSIGALWAYGDTIGKIRSYRRGRRTGGPSRPEIVSREDAERSGPLVAVLVVELALVALLTLSALVVRFTDLRPNALSATGLPVPGLVALLLLAAMVRLFGRLRGKIPTRVWCALAAIAILCAAVNLGLSIAWLLPGRHTPVRSMSAPQPRETGLLTIPVLLPSGRYDRSGELTLEPGLRIHVECPQPVRWKLLRNGTVVHESKSLFLDVPVTEPGEYRLEGRSKVGGEDRVVLLSKPLHIRPASGDSTVP